jgi:hypothetical protein
MCNFQFQDLAVLSVEAIPRTLQASSSGGM